MPDKPTPAKTDDRPVVLRTNMGAGHEGAAGRFDRLAEIAYVQAFALAVSGASDLARPSPE